jgi:dsDNA-specific endonuclease/ATPase MutS2
MDNADILKYQIDVFVKTMEENLSRKGFKIVFIHGKGDGVLRSALLKELKSRYRNCRWQDASFREYGFGATLVTIG